MKKKVVVKKSVKSNSASSVAPVKKPAASAVISKSFDPYKKILSDLRRRVAGGLEHIESEALKTSQRDATGDLSGYSLHMADAATDNFDMEFNINLASNEQQYLNLIDSALQRIDEGTYGVCEDCSKPIPQKRLMAMPFARLCIACQEQEEKKARRA